MRVKPADIDRAARDGAGAGADLYLLFGPDEAASAQQAQALIASLGEGTERVTLTGQQLREDPARLSDEACSLSLFGDRRVVRVDASGDEIFAAVDALLAGPATENPVIALAPSLTAKSRTTKLADGSQRAMACINYLPQTRDMMGIVNRLARDAGLTLSPAMIARIAETTAHDRRLAASEIEKLALYHDARADAPVTVDRDAFIALSAPHSDDAIGPLVNAVFSGERQRLAVELARARANGQSTIGTVMALQRRAMQLTGLAAKLSVGNDPARLVKGERRIHFSEADAFVRQLERWDMAMLDRASALLLDLQSRIMRSGATGEVLFERGLFDIAAIPDAGRPGTDRAGLEACRA